MRVDENEFFREATLRICSSLEIEKSLQSFLVYLGGFMPADRLLVQVSYEDVEFASTTLLADVDRNGLIAANLKLPPSPEMRELISILRSANLIAQHPSGIGFKVNLPKQEEIPGLIKSLRLDRFFTDFRKRDLFYPFISRLDSVYEDVRTKSLARARKLPDSPLLAIVLLADQSVLGSLMVVNNSGQDYTSEHMRLLSLLNEPLSIALSNSLRYNKMKELQQLLAEENLFLKSELREKIDKEIVGAEFDLKPAMELVKQVAPLNSPVLLLGETGVGKEVFANAVHDYSPRRNGPLVTVNCGAIPDTLIDSELFGHEKGAFTGAFARKKGRFELADKGTIFLDEIAELPLDAQVRLLRVLQEKVVERVGGTESIPVDIRIVAATHRNLEAMVQQGTFREDLYFRLKVFPIVIPPLRERVSDIPLLVQHFLRRKTRELKIHEISTVAPGAVDRLMSYDWPGNVRELENTIERAIILSRGKPLTFDDIIPSGRSVAAERSRLLGNADSPRTLDSVVADHIGRTLEQTGGKVHGEGGAADLLGLNPSTLRNKMRRLGIPFGRIVKKKQGAAR